MRGQPRAAIVRLQQDAGIAEAATLRLEVEATAATDPILARQLRAACRIDRQCAFLVRLQHGNALNGAHVRIQAADRSGEGGTRRSEHTEEKGGHRGSGYCDTSAHGSLHIR